MMAIPDTLSALFVPISSKLSGIFGKQVQTLFFTCKYYMKLSWSHLLALCMAMSHYFLAYSNPPEYVSSPVPILVILGICYSNLFLCYSLIPVIIENRKLGLALYVCLYVSIETNLCLVEYRHRCWIFLWQLCRPLSLILSSWIKHTLLPNYFSLILVLEQGFVAYLFTLWIKGVY